MKTALKGTPYAGAALAVALTLVGCAGVEKAPPVVAAPAPAIQLYAAGSLRTALNAIASDYEARTGQKITLTYGPSGLLRERLEKGEAAQVCSRQRTPSIRNAWRSAVAGRRRLFLCAMACAR